MASPTLTRRLLISIFRAHFRMIFYSKELCDRYLANAPDLGSASATGEAVSKAVADLDLTPQMAHFHFPTLVIQGRFRSERDSRHLLDSGPHRPRSATRLVREKRSSALLRRTR